MGTRRSRHNKGRKPFYKEHRLVGVRKSDRRDRGLGHLTGHRLMPEAAPAVWESFLQALATRSALEVAKMPGMPSATAFNMRRESRPEFSTRADAIIASRTLSNSGRPKIAPDRLDVFLRNIKRMPVCLALAKAGAPSTAWVYKQRLRDAEFRSLLEAAPNGRELPKGPRRAVLAYPYIMTRRDEHTDILAINDIVPHAFPDQMRADICQEAMLAVLEGKITIAELRANASKSAWFLRKFYRDNFECAGRAVYLSDEDEKGKSFDEIVSAIAARDWHSGEINERRRSFDAIQRFQPPTQIEDTFQGQVRRRWIAMQEAALQSGDMRDMLSFEDVAALMDEMAAA